MLFLMRSAVCIGLVVSALPDHPRPSSFDEAITSVGPSALAELCRADATRCRVVAATLLPSEASPPPPRPRRLRDQPAAASSRLSRAAPVL